jgi:hypothetical protein
MSFKAVFLIFVVLVIGTFAYFKYEVMGDPNSNFNQTTRFVLGAHPVIRAVLGIHNRGDARVEFLHGTGPLVIKWFQPDTESLEPSLIQSFADAVAKNTGRQTQVIYGGYVSDGIVDLNSLQNLVAKGPGTPSNSSVLYVVFATDYQPKDSGELSTTKGETTIVFSLTAHRNFLESFPQNLNSYLLAGMLHEFGNEIGLPEQGTDPNCIMNLHAGINGQPLEAHAYTEPQDYCPAEQTEIQQLKVKY